MFEAIDNVVLTGSEDEISEWCKRNKVYDAITEEEIEENWKNKDPDENEPIRLNGKYVWETAKRVTSSTHAKTSSGSRHLEKTVS